nr:hypothetical protein CFP56_57555 [Quercus suber]
MKMTDGSKDQDLASRSDARLQLNDEIPLPPEPAELPQDPRRERLAHDATVQLSSLSHLRAQPLSRHQPEFPTSASRPFARLVSADSASTIPVSLPSRDDSGNHSAFENPFADPTSSADQRDTTGSPLVTRGQSQRSTLTLAEQRTGMSMPQIFTGRGPVTQPQQSFPLVNEPLTPPPIPLPIPPLPPPRIVQFRLERQTERRRWTNRLPKFPQGAVIGIVLLAAVAAGIILYVLHPTIERSLRKRWEEVMR